MKRVAGQLKKRLEKVLDAAIELADLGAAGISSFSIVETIYESEPELMEELKPFWMMDRLFWIINRQRQIFRREQRGVSQLVLPGFQGLPWSIFLPSGERRILDNADMDEIRAHIEMLRARLKPHSRIGCMEAVLGLMKKYSAEGSRITWGEVKKLEFERSMGT